MNCVKGDVARYVGKDIKNCYGYVVKCVRRHDGKKLSAWIVDPPLPVIGGDWIADKALRPIHDNPGNESWFKSAPLERAKPAEVEA